MIRSRFTCGPAWRGSRSIRRSPNSPQKILDLYDLREALEGHAAFHGALLRAAGNRLALETVLDLAIQVCGDAPLDEPVTVNDAPARRAGNRFFAEVVLRDVETEIVAATNGRFGRQTHRVRVVWDRNSFPRYRFSIDDNSFFLRDIAQQNYRSLFDIVCNNTPIDKVAPTLEPLAADPNHAEIMDLFTHEQYFWPFYRAYVPDHFQRLDATLRWVTERGYKPVFFHEGFLGAK